MLKMKHRDEAITPDDDEQRIRDDERQRVLAELRDGGSDVDGDWRTTPPTSDEPRFADPARGAAVADVPAPRSPPTPARGRSTTRATPGRHRSSSRPIATRSCSSGRGSPRTSS